jgi:hypothetical protein
VRACDYDLYKVWTLPSDAAVPAGYVPRVT